MTAINVYEPQLYFNVNIRPWAPSAPKENVWDKGLVEVFLPSWKFNGPGVSSIKH